MVSNPDLAIDLGAAAQQVSDDDFAAWAVEQRAFISSVMSEFEEERFTLADWLQEMGVEPVMFERFGGREDDPETAYLSEVESSTIYLGLIGRTYGRVLSTGLSATHTEYLAAERAGLRMIVSVKQVEEREGHEQSFLDGIQMFRTTDAFTTAIELATNVERRLRKIAAEDLAPWAKLGPLVFRTKEIRDSGNRVVVTARVRDAGILSTLRSMRPDEWGRGFEGSFVYGDEASKVRVTEVEVTASAGKGADVRLELVRGDPSREPLFGAALSQGARTYSPEELTVIRLREGLFGDPPPEPGLTELLGEVTRPLEPLRGMRLSDEVVRPIARLLLVEALVGSGRASRVTMFRLGSSVGARRRLELAWKGPRGFSDSEPDDFMIEGYVSFSEARGEPEKRMKDVQDQWLRDGDRVDYRGGLYVVEERGLVKWDRPEVGSVVAWADIDRDQLLKAGSGNLWMRHRRPRS